MLGACILPEWFTYYVMAQIVGVWSGNSDTDFIISPWLFSCKVQHMFLFSNLDLYFLKLKLVFCLVWFFFFFFAFFFQYFTPVLYCDLFSAWYFLPTNCFFFHCNFAFLPFLFFFLSLCLYFFSFIPFLFLVFLLIYFFTSFFQFLTFSFIFESLVFFLKICPIFFLDFTLSLSYIIHLSFFLSFFLSQFFFFLSFYFF